MVHRSVYSCYPYGVNPTVDHSPLKRGVSQQATETLKASSGLSLATRDPQDPEQVMQSRWSPQGGGVEPWLNCGQ